MPKVTKPANALGDFLVDYEEKVFEDVKADPGEKALVTFHTVAFEGSIGLVNLLQATRLQRKGSKPRMLLVWPRRPRLGVNGAVFHRSRLPTREAETAKAHRG